MTELEYIRTYYPDAKLIQDDNDQLLQNKEFFPDYEYILNQHANCNYIAWSLNWDTSSDPEVKFFMDDVVKTNIYFRLYQKLLFKDKTIIVVSYRKLLGIKILRKILSNYNGPLSNVEHSFL